MINNSVIKNQIYTEINSTEKLSDNYEKCAVECLLYKYILSVISEDPSKSNALSSTISSYSSEFISKFNDAKEKYICYNKIIEYLTDIEKLSILTMLDAQINKVYSLYGDKTEKSEFSINQYSQTMYNVSGLSTDEDDYLFKIHKNVLARIMLYYMDIYKADPNSLKIVSATDSSIVGKVITFYISGISSAQVYRDITNNKINIEYLDVKCEYPYVTIINL